MYIMFEQFKEIIEEMRLVYLHDKRPWMIGFSGGKDSTLLCQLVFEMLNTLKPEQIHKKIYIVTSDTMVENPIVKSYMYRMRDAINNASAAKNLKVEAKILYPEIKQTFWSLVIGLGYPTPEAPGFRWCTERLKINPSNKFTYDTIKKDGDVVILLGVRKAESATRARSIAAHEIEGKILSRHVSIPKAYVYNPLTEIDNSVVWEYLLKDDAVSAWGTDNKFLFSLYQGENLGEEQKGGLNFSEIKEVLLKMSDYTQVKVLGLMAMLPDTTNEVLLVSLLENLRAFYDELKLLYNFKYLSVGMSNDYLLAIKHGSNMVRIGTKIFGRRY